MIKISIIVPTYNRANLISETLASIFYQTYLNWECLIIDDHSTDNTKTVVKTFIKKDNRFQYYLNERTKGAQGARNTGIDKSTGQYIIFIDSDDLLAKHCLENRIKFLEKKDLDFYCFATAVFQKKPGDTKYLWNYLNKNSSDIIRFIEVDPPWHTSGVIWKKQTLAIIGGWDEKLTCWQDWDIHLRAVMNKKLIYKKTDNNCIDSYYRKPIGEYISISNKEFSESSISSKIYIVNKFLNLLDISNIEVRLSFAKLVYRISSEIFISGSKKKSLYFLFRNLKYMKFSNIYSVLWVIYFRTTFMRPTFYFIGLKYLLKVVPHIYKKTSLLIKSNTALIAKINDNKCNYENN